MIQMQNLLEGNKQEQPQYTYTIFIFANLQSGGKLGRKIKDAQVKSIELSQVSNTSVHFYIINEPKSRKAGLQLLESLSQELDMRSNRIVALAGGGDGTVNWLLAELIAAGIDFNRVIFGAFPLGTGNDFAKNLGWPQYNLFDNHFAELHRFVREVEEAHIEEFNIWDVEVFAHQQGGYIVKEKHSDGLIVMVNEETQTQRNHLLKRFNNYFSFGMDARVGYDFNRHRSQKQFANYVLYFLIGMFNEFRSIPHLSDIVTKMEMEQTQPGLEENSSPMKNNKVLFSKESGVGVSEKYRNIVALNINYYMGGVPNIWANCYRNGANLIDKTTKFKQTSHSDGLLEFVSFKDEWSLGFERFFKGRGRRMAQGTGPFRFEFEPSCAFTYLNFDGEYYKVTKPLQIVIRLSSYFQKAKLRVIRRRN